MVNRKALVLGVFLLTTCGSSRAASMVYTNQATFTAAAPSLTVNNLNGTPSSNAPVTVGGITVSEIGSSQDAGIYNADVGQGKSLQFTTAAGGAVRLTFASAISAVGFNIFDLGDIGSTTLSYTLSNGDTGNLFSNYTGSDGNSLFAGLISTSAFTYITLTNSRVGDFVEIDDVRYGLASPAVPEPSSIILLGVGLGLFGVRQMRGRRSRG